MQGASAANLFLSRILVVIHLDVNKCLDSTEIKTELQWIWVQLDSMNLYLSVFGGKEPGYKLVLF